MFVVSLLFSFGNKSFGNSIKDIVIAESRNDFNNDSIPGKTSFGVIKINPIQVLFSEIPVSFEVNLPRKSSVQFQLGLIFPFPEKSFERRVFEESGENGEVSSNGLISYRKSPYNNS